MALLPVAKTGDVAPQFPQQRVRKVFRMGLHEQKKAPRFCLREQVDAGVPRSRQHFVAAGLKIFFRKIVPS